MVENLKLAGLSRNTARIYLYYAEYFSRHFMRSPADMGAAEVRTFLLYLLEERKLSQGTYKQCFAALKFLYGVTLRRPFEFESIPRSKKKSGLPSVLSGSEIQSLFSGFTHPRYRTVAMTIYAAGLRISEACRLAAKDIDSKRMVIHVRKGKGGRDRYVMLSVRLLDALREWWKVARPSHLLFEGKKGPEYPMSGSAFRNALRRACAKAGIKKKVTSHILRHSFATHLMEMGTDIRLIQFILGHRYITATMGYTHLSTRHLRMVKSPLDILGTAKGRMLG
jgi:site-specific recombinase XerD